MNGIVEAAAELQKWMVDSRQQFCLIGGLAVIRWNGVSRRPSRVEGIGRQRS